MTATVALFRELSSLCTALSRGNRGPAGGGGSKDPYTLMSLPTMLTLSPGPGVRTRNSLCWREGVKMETKKENPPTLLVGM